MNNVTYLGRSYGDETDWRALIRDVAKLQFGPSWLRADLDIPSALADLADKLRGTRAEAELAEASLAAIESGTPQERLAVWQLPWERGRDAVTRLLNIVQTDLRRVDEVRGLPNVIWRLLQAYPDDVRVQRLLHEEAARPSADPWIVDMARNQHR